MWEGIEVGLGKLNLTKPSTFYPYTSYINPYAAEPFPGNCLY